MENKSVLKRFIHRVIMADLILVLVVAWSFSFKGEGLIILLVGLAVLLLGIPLWFYLILSYRGSTLYRLLLNGSIIAMLGSLYLFKILTPVPVIFIIGLWIFDVYLIYRLVAVFR